MKSTLTVRSIVIAGVLGAVAILLGVTRLGYIPVPTAAGNATIMHIPAIIGGIMQGPVVGFIVGLIFGVSSFLNATVPLFKDPLVAILPRLVYWGNCLACIRRDSSRSEYLAVGTAAFLGTLTNTGLVLTMAVIRGYLSVEVAWTVADYKWNSGSNRWDDCYISRCSSMEANRQREKIKNIRGIVIVLCVHLIKIA